MASPPPSDQGLTNSSSASNNQSLRWSLQNFPVPVQLQARIPRSPLSVAQELLPNFPQHQQQQQHRGHLQHSRASEEAEDVEFVDLQQQERRQQQFEASLQQHIQQQLLQQFTRQLQQNLHGGGETQSGPAILPEPPDETVVDMLSNDGENGEESGVRGLAGGRLGGAFRSISSNSSSRQLFESLFRSAQAAATSSPSTSSSLSSLRQNSNNNSGAGGVDNVENSGTYRASSSGGNNTGGLGLSHLGPTHHHLHHQHSEGGDVGGGAGDGMGSNSAQQGGRAGPVAGQSEELSLLYKWAAESGIFILLLLLHFLYDHRLGLLVFLCLGGTFYYTNMKLVHAIHQSAVREQSRSWLGFLNLTWLCGFLLLNIVILYYVFSDQQLWRILWFQMASVQDISVWTLLWCVVMTDYIIKFITVIIKSLLAMMQPLFKNYRRRGKYYLLIESMSQLYRQIVTVVPWLYYLNDSTRTSVWFAFITEAVYLGFKSWGVWGSIQFVYTSYQRFQSNTSFGTKPSSSDMLERGNQCPICQDSVNEPVMLPCKHIFCEQCVSIWFDREKTCPMCRAEITTESPMWKDGNTSAHLQWH